MKTLLILEELKARRWSDDYIDDFLGTVEEYDFQEAEMIEAFVDFQNDLLLYGIDFELRNEVTE